MGIGRTAQESSARAAGNAISRAAGNVTEMSGSRVYNSNTRGRTPVGDNQQGRTPADSGYGQQTASDPYGYGGYGGYGGGWGGYGGGGWGGFGGYGGGNTGPTDIQKDTAENLKPIVHYNYDTLDDKFKLGDKVYDTADEQSKNLQNWQLAMAERNASGDWYRQQQKLQSAMKNMRDEMGNAAYGSDFADMYEAFARADDQMDDDTLQAFRKNLEEIDANYYEALMNNVSSRNKLAADTEVSMRELGADWAAQLNNIHPELAQHDGGDNTDKYGSSIDKDNDTLKFPDWLDTDYAKAHWSEAIKPEAREFYRPDVAAQTASNSGRRNRNTSTASAAVRKTKGIASYLQPYSGNSMNRKNQ